MLLDSSAWIDLIQGGRGMQRVKDALKEGGCYTSIVTLSEVTNWLLKDGRDVKPYIEGITQLSLVINLDEGIATLAGRLNFERKKIVGKWGMMDSIILATSRTYGQRILTKDTDYKDLSETEML